ncbi:MAG: hypothetical protein J0H74_33070 [Chitinophagaceae bacterium]|nr:hypothetical protein [Chitinophagaceae bacterium]
MKINKGKLAVFSLILNGVFVLFFAGKRYYYSHSVPTSTTYEDNWNAARESILSVLPIDSNDIIFLGNSLTEGFPVEEMFHSTHIKNRGIRGNQSKHIIGRINEIVDGHPRKLFLDIGINDILQNVPLDTLFANYKVIINIIRDKSPSTQLYVQSVFPVGVKEKKYEATVEAFNKQLKAYCLEKGIMFIDLFPSFYRDEGLDPSLTYDDIHLNGKGYEIWKKAIDSLVN